MPSAGDVILAEIQYTDTYETKLRPAVVLYEELDNIIVAGITSNKKMKGIPLTTEEGAVKNSVIKLNYIFTISRMMIKKSLFSLNDQKKKSLYRELNRRIAGLKR